MVQCINRVALKSTILETITRLLKSKISDGTVNTIDLTVRLLIGTEYIYTICKLVNYNNRDNNIVIGKEYLNMNTKYLNKMKKKLNKFVQDIWTAII